MDRILDVIRIVLPVFAVIALGKGLAVRGLFGEDRQKFVNWIVFYIALPALIFNAVARQSIADFFDVAFWTASFVPIAVVLVAYMVLGKALGFRKGVAAIFVFGTFWANVTYMGLPLSLSAFGLRGLQLAAVYNAVCMPTFVVMGFVLIAFYVGTSESGMRWRSAFWNPIVGSAVAAFLVVVIRHATGTPHPVFVQAGRTFGAFLQLVGGMGLPLALLSIGASLEFRTISDRWGVIAMTAFGKLVVLPLLAWLIFRLFFPAAAPEAVGVVVLLCGMPVSVASFVVARQLGMEEELVASLLVVSTCASVVTIPAWLYFLI